jgi:hypothetical protein
VVAACGEFTSLVSGKKFTGPANIRIDIKDIIEPKLATAFHPAKQSA